jgi:AraC-like DNA-binding protein
MTLPKAVFVRLCRARSLLRDAPDRPRAIRDVARAAAMSPFHFTRTFHAVFGETPHQFRIRTRLDRARHLLAVSDFSVTDICMEVGFTSLGSFSHLFARRVGVAPSVYRRRVRSLMRVRDALPRELTPGCLTLMGAAFAAISEKQRPTVLAHSADHEDQADQHHGRRPGQGLEVLHGNLRLREEAGDPDGRVQVADRRLARRPR